MNLFKCPNCRLCIDLEISFKKQLCPMCGIPLDHNIDNKPHSIDKKC